MASLRRAVSEVVDGEAALTDALAGRDSDSVGLAGVALGGGRTGAGLAAAEAGHAGAGVVHVEAGVAHAGSGVGEHGVVSAGQTACC